MKKHDLQWAEQWFKSRGWKPFEFQRAAWRDCLAGKSTLIHSATGTGKTLAAWMGPLLRWNQDPIPESEWTRQRRSPSAPPMLLLWVTPLRALAQDTYTSLANTLASIESPWSLELRTGDTSATRKARQRERLPTALITTPESLSLMLSYPEAKDLFRFLRHVVVDEWHELLGSKRGVLLELALGRLRSLIPNYQVCGLSATLGNLEQSMRVLVGPRFTGDFSIIHGKTDKVIHLRSAIPPSIERFPWAGHLGTQLAEQVIETIDQSDSALIFTNTRSQTEMWYQHLLARRSDLAGQLAVHHGSLDSSVRAWVENSLRDGKLRAAVCTSSLDLGVDFTAVDQVVQVGSPKGVARLLQRAGRSGHQPSAASRLLFVPTNALELIELAAARVMVERSQFEAREPVEKPLDLLTQHLVTRAIAEPYDRQQVLDELHATHAFRNLTAEELEWAIAFAKHGGDTLARYEDFRRLEEDESGRLHVSNPRVIRRHRMSIGTIVSDVAVQVRWMNGKNLGTVEETFVARLKPGERFLLAGKLVEMVQLHDSVVWVRRAKGVPTAIPRWLGGRMPLSSQLSSGMREQIEAASHDRYDGIEMEAVRPILELQQRWSHLPTTQELLIEKICDREGHHLFFYPFEGRLVHEGLAAVVAYRISKSRRISFSIAANDHGFVLQSPTDPEVSPDQARDWLSERELMDDILASLNATEMAKRQFREIARIAGLIHQGFPGEKRSARHLQASSDLIYQVFAEYDPNNLLLNQARNEVLQQQLEWNRLQATLERIKRCTIVWREPVRMTPFAFPLLVDRLRERLSNETLAERVRRMQASLEQAANKLK